MFHTIVQPEDYKKMCHFLGTKTSFKFESGAEIWPCDNIKRSSIFRAQKKGLSVLFLFSGKNQGNGNTVSNRDFCVEILRKFAI